MPAFALTVGVDEVSKVRYMPFAPVVGGWTDLLAADVRGAASALGAGDGVLVDVGPLPCTVGEGAAGTVKCFSLSGFDGCVCRVCWALPAFSDVAPELMVLPTQVPLAVNA
jgi:hypothetical protein